LPTTRLLEEQVVEAIRLYFSKDTCLKTSLVVAMSEEKQYVMVRIPKFFDDLINKYIEAHQEELRLLGLRASRAGVVKKALYEFLKKEGIIQSK